MSWHLLLVLAVAAVGTLADHVATAKAIETGAHEKRGRLRVSWWIMEKTGHIWPATIAFDALLLVGGALLLWRISPAFAEVWLAVAGLVQLAVARKNWRLAKRREARG